MRPEGPYHPFSPENEEPALLSERQLVYVAKLLTQGAQPTTTKD